MDLFLTTPISPTGKNKISKRYTNHFLSYHADELVLEVVE
jgi:hypothetical protein